MFGTVVANLVPFSDFPIQQTFVILGAALIDRHVSTQGCVSMHSAAAILLERGTKHEGNVRGSMLRRHWRDFRVG